MERSSLEYNTISSWEAIEIIKSAGATRKFPEATDVPMDLPYTSIFPSPEVGRLARMIAIQCFNSENGVRPCGSFA